MQRVLAAIALLVLAGCASTFDLQGHRGTRGLAPENTLPAFERALRLGVTTLEMDVAITKDGVVVVSHDPALNPDITRGPNGEWLEKRGPLIRDLTYAELQRYDVGRIKPGSAYAQQFPEQAAVDGTRIPRLADVFALVRRSGNATVRFDIETKVFPNAPEATLPPHEFTRALIAEVRAARMASRTMIQSFYWATLQVVQREAPEIETVYLTAQRKGFDTICRGAAAGDASLAHSQCEPSPWTAGFDLRDHGSVPKLVKAAGGTLWAPHHQDVDAAKVKEAQSLGLRVLPWTVNDPARIAAVLDMGVDGIISDRPDFVRAEMSKRGMPLPH